MKTILSIPTIAALLTLGSPLAQGAVVFSEVNLAENTITLTNTDGSSVDLGGWRFCSHDVDSVRVYSSPSQFDGISIAAGSSLVVDTTSIPFAGLLGGNTLSVGLYNDLDGSLSFGSADDLSAFIQFAPEGTIEIGQAEFRTNTAVSAGLWDAEGSFVQVNGGNSMITLNDLNNATGSSSYSVVPETQSTLLIAITGVLTVARRRRGH